MREMKGGPVRVLLVHNFYKNPGGEDSVVHEELSTLRENSVDVELFSASNDGIEGAWHSIATAVNATYSLSARRRLAKKLAEFRPDIVHIHNFFPLLSPSILDACEEAGVPSVLTLHNFRILCPTAFLGLDPDLCERSLHQSSWWTVRRRVYRNSIFGTAAVAAMVEVHKRIGTWRRKVSRFIALSDWAKAKFVEGGLPEQRITVKPNCIGVSTDHPPAAQRRGAIFVGRLDEQKGIDTLLRSWRDLDYPLKIIGDGPLADLVRQSQNSRITWLGRLPRDAVQREMQQADVLVLPSRGHEMFPMTIVEAFANRLPVICSDTPSLRAIVAEGKTGHFFPAADPAALAQKFRWAAANRPALADMGATAFATYQRTYTRQKNFDQLMKIYASLLPVEAAAAS